MKLATRLKQFYEAEEITDAMLKEINNGHDNMEFVGFGNVTAKNLREMGFRYHRKTRSFISKSEII